MLLLTKSCSSSAAYYHANLFIFLLQSFHVSAAEYAAGRAHDRALLQLSNPSDAQHINATLNFPLHDYTSDADQAVQAAAAAMTQLPQARRQAALSHKRKRSSLDTHKPAAAPKRRAVTDETAAPDAIAKHHTAAAAPADVLAAAAAAVTQRPTATDNQMDRLMPTNRFTATGDDPSAGLSSTLKQKPAAQQLPAAAEQDTAAIHPFFRTHAAVGSSLCTANATPSQSSLNTDHTPRQEQQKQQQRQQQHQQQHQQPMLLDPLKAQSTCSVAHGNAGKQDATRQPASPSNHANIQHQAVSTDASSSEAPAMSAEHAVPAGEAELNRAFAQPDFLTALLNGVAVPFPVESTFIPAAASTAAAAAAAADPVNSNAAAILPPTNLNNQSRSASQQPPNTGRPTLRRLSQLHTTLGAVETVLATNNDSDVEIMDCSPEPEQAPVTHATAPATHATQQQPSSKAMHAPTAARQQAQSRGVPFTKLPPGLQTAPASQTPHTSAPAGVLSFTQTPSTTAVADAKGTMPQVAAVKQEGNRSSGSNPGGKGPPLPDVHAGSSSAHPLELSDSESERKGKRRRGGYSSSTSSSVHAEDRAPRRRLHADTAASHGPSHEQRQLLRQDPSQQFARQVPQQVPKSNGHQQQLPEQQVPRRRPIFDPRLRVRTQQLPRQLPGQVLQQPGQQQQVRQQQVGPQPHFQQPQQLQQQQHLKQQQAPPVNKAPEAGLNALAARRNAHCSQIGSNAEQAQVVSSDDGDDDDDVVIIEAGMQPKPTGAPSGSAAGHSSHVLMLQSRI